MSKMACRCGAIISDSRYPCPTEGEILRQQDQEAFYSNASRVIVSFFQASHAGHRQQWIADHPSTTSMVDDFSDEEIVNQLLTGVVNSVVSSICECENCGRLHVQCKPDRNSYRSYRPDESGYASVLRAASLPAVAMHSQQPTVERSPRK